MGLVRKGENEKQRKRMNSMSRYSFSSLMVRPEHMMEERKEWNANITTDEVICPHCGFKARYQFIRCPQCNEIHKEHEKREETK